MSFTYSKILTFPNISPKITIVKIIERGTRRARWSSWAQSNIQWIWKNEIIIGDEDGGIGSDVSFIGYGDVKGFSVDTNDCGYGGDGNDCGDDDGVDGIDSLENWFQWLIISMNLNFF